MATERVLYERRLEKIFDMLLLGLTNEEIASHFQITTRSVQKYKRKLEDRYMKYQEQKNYKTWALESTLLKNRLLSLYRNLDRKIADSRTSTADSAKAAQVAMDIAVRIMDLENKGIYGVIQLSQLARDEEAKTKLEQDKEASIKSVREYLQNKDSESNIERWRNSTYYNPEYENGDYVLEHLCDGNGLFPGEPGYDDQYKF